MKKANLYLFLSIFTDIIFVILSTFGISMNFLSLYIACAVVIFLIHLSSDINFNIFLIMFLVSFSLFFMFYPTYHFFIPSLPEFHTYNEALSVILVAFLALKTGYFLKILIFNTYKDNQKNYNKSKEKKEYSLAAFFLYLFTLPFFLFFIVTRINIMKNFGYTAIYQNVSLGIIGRISQFNPSFYYIFLACLPEMKFFYKSLMIYIPVQMFLLMTGSRSQFVVSFMVILSYIVIRKTLENKKVKLNLKIIIISLSSFIFISIFMMIISQIRINDSVDFDNAIINFMKQQGSTYLLLSRGISLKEVFKDISGVFSLQAIINGSFIIKSFFQYILPDLYINSFNHNLGNVYTYFFEPAYYNIGGSFGTSYLLELYLDGGYTLVFIYNVILGYFLTIVDIKNFNKWVYFSFILLVINSIFFIPRESSLNYINQIISFTNLIAISFVYIFGKIILFFKEK